MPQQREPGRAAFGQRLPFERTASSGPRILALIVAAEGRLGLRLRELRVGLDVDLPAGEAARGEAGVQALLADRERELVIRHDDGRLARVVVHEHLADARRESAFAMKRAASFHGMMSIFSPRSSDTTMRTREPRGPTQAPTGSTPWACDSTAIFER